MDMAEVCVLGIRNSEGKHASQRENYEGPPEQVQAENLPVIEWQLRVGVCV